MLSKWNLRLQGLQRRFANYEPLFSDHYAERLKREPRWSSTRRISVQYRQRHFSSYAQDSAPIGILVSQVNTDCAVILSEEGTLPPKNSIKNARFFNKDNINDFHVSEFNYFLFIGDNMDKYIDNARLIRIIHECAISSPKRPMGFVGNTRNILTKFKKQIDLIDANKIEFITTKMIDDIEYISDPINKIVLSSSETSYEYDDIIQMLVLMVHNDEYELICARSSTFEKDHFLDEHIATINGEKYVMAYCHINDDVFKDRIRELNKDLSEKELEYITNVFVHALDESYTIILINESYTKIYFIQITQDRNNYFVCDFYEPLYGYCDSLTCHQRMNVINLELIPQNIDGFKQVFKSELFSEDNAFLCKMIKKYESTIEDVINANTFPQFVV